MKRLIAISVVFALVAGAAFAADVSGSVIGTVNVLEGDNGTDSKVTSSGGMDRMRVEVSGEDGDGVFGGWARIEGFYTDKTEGDFSGKPWEDAELRLFKPYALAWWKPMDMFKLTIGGNPDGHFGKEGVTGWMFYQSTSDTSAVNAGNVWGGGYGGDGYGTYRSAHYGGFGYTGLMMEISPADMVNINIGIPFFDDAGEFNEASDNFKKAVVQLDFNLDFGNIAVTYVGDVMKGGDQPTIFGFFALSSIENLGLDLGLGYKFPTEDGYANPIYVSVGVKYALDTFGVKFRTLAGLAGDDKNTTVRADVMPYYAISDTLRAFVSIGLGVLLPDSGDTLLDWHFNPYLEVGSEWGPKFIAGIKVWTEGNGDKMTWQVPIALAVSF